MRKKLARVMMVEWRFAKMMCRVLRGRERERERERERGCIFFSFFFDVDGLCVRAPCSCSSYIDDSVKFGVLREREREIVHVHKGPCYRNLKFLQRFLHLSSALLGRCNILVVIVLLFFVVVVVVVVLSALNGISSRNPVGC